MIGHKYLQDHVWTHLKVLEALDMTGGNCNLDDLTVLRAIETKATNPYKDTSQKKADAALPHEWLVCSVAHLVHQFADKMLPMKHYIGQHGEVVECCDIPNVIKLIYKAFGLDKVTKRIKVDLCGSMDGFNLTKCITFVMVGIKMVDPNLINPQTGAKELFSLFKKFLPQSRGWCFPLKLVMVKESTEIYQEEFQDVFDIFY